MEDGSKIFCGIDPGATGAIACITKDLHIFSLVDYDESPEGDFIETIERLAYLDYVVYLEKVHSMPGQGVSSTFKFGQVFGFVRGLLASKKIKFFEVTPQAWQKGVIEKTEGVKKPSLDLARKLFPEAPLSRQKDHNRADALIMAYKSLLDYNKGLIK